jgi:hypothetical protein
MQLGAFRGLGDAWGAETSPSGVEGALANAANQVAPGIVDYAQSIITVGESFVSALNRARTQVSMTDAQRQLLDIQIQRAQQGLPPLSTAQYTTPGIVGGMSNQTLLLIVAGAALVFMLSRR